MISASPRFMASLMVRAPSEPPTTATSGLSGSKPSSLRASGREMYAAEVRFFRTGLPVSIIRPAGKKRSIPS